jgi:hypothetical protein
MLDRAKERITAALSQFPEDAVFLASAAHVAFLQGRGEEARSLIAEAIRRGGEELRREALEDTERYPLPVEEEWRKIIRAVPA